LKRSFDYDRVKAKVWYVPIVLLVPGANFLAYGLMRLMGFAFPSPEFPVSDGTRFCSSHYSSPRREKNLGRLDTSLTGRRIGGARFKPRFCSGLVWAVSHIVPLPQVHRSPAGSPGNLGMC
jgi:hypothetical protein